MGIYYKGKRAMTRPIIVKTSVTDLKKVTLDAAMCAAHFLYDNLEIGKETSFSLTPAYEEVTTDDYIEMRSQIMPQTFEQFHENYRKLLIYLDWKLYERNEPVFVEVIE